MPQVENMSGTMQQCHCSPEDPSTLARLFSAAWSRPVESEKFQQVS